MASTPIPLSASQGGDRVKLDSVALPGKLIHENPANSGQNHLVTDILVVNPNPNNITLWTTIQGPGIPVPTEKNQEQMVRIDVGPTAEGNEPRLFYTPFILAPGYSYYVTCTSPDNPGTVYLFGYAETSSATGAAAIGNGGLITLAEQSMADIPANTWATVPFEAGLLTTPVNVTQDPANNRFSINQTGIWNIQVYGVINVKKKTADRYAYWRFYDETAGQPNSPHPFPIPLENGNNFGTWSVGLLIEVNSSNVNHIFRFEMGDAKQIGAGDVPIEDIVVAKAGISVNKVAELPGT